MIVDMIYEIAQFADVDVLKAIRLTSKEMNEIASMRLTFNAGGFNDIPSVKFHGISIKCDNVTNLVLKVLRAQSRAYIDLSSSNVSDASMLGGAYTLNLCNTNVSDVSMLGGVTNLKADVFRGHPWSNIHVLDLTGFDWV